MPYKDRNQALEAGRRWREKHREYLREKAKKYRIINKEAISKQRKEYYQKNRLKELQIHKDMNIRKWLIKIGWTFEQYEEELAKGCPICGSKSDLVFDHDHKSDKFRSLLCNKCNRLLGHAKDDIEILQKAIDYLCRHSLEVARL